LRLVTRICSLSGVSLSTMRFRFCLLALSLLVSVRAAYDPIPGADEKWRRYESPHFEVYSRNPDSESRELLHNLELSHAIFFETFGYKVSRVVPVTVYFFSREKTFEAYKPESMRKVEALSAFYHADLDRGVMTVAPLPTYEAAQQLAFGCYTYHLFRLLGDRPPTWFMYGMSGLFSNLKLESTRFELGKADPGQVGRLQTARLMPVEVMLGADQNSTAFTANQGNHLFHDQSWAMLHYLYFGEHKLPKEKVDAFLAYALAHSGTFDAAETRQVFEQTMGMSYAQLDQALDRYFRNGRYGYRRVTLPVIPPAKDYVMRKVPLAEIRLRLAELALRVNRAPEGKLALLQVPAASPETARVQEVLAGEALKDGDGDRAADRLWKAVDAGSTNPAVLQELAQFEDRQRFRHFDLYYRLPEESATRLRELLKRSIAVAPQQLSAYEILAWVEASAQDPSIANVNLVQKKFEDVKISARTLLALAVVRMRLGDKAGATEMLDIIGRMEPDDSVRYGLESTRAKLEDRPVNRDNLPAARPASRDPVLARPVSKPRM
jgi:hypothetical protein